MERAVKGEAPRPLVQAPDIRLIWPETSPGRNREPGAGPITARVDRLAGIRHGLRKVALMKALRARRTVAKADVILAMNEEEGLAAALLKRLRVPGYRASRICVIGVRLTERVRTMPDAARRRTVKKLDGVDSLLVYSSNQAATLADAFGINLSRVRTIPLGVDGDFFDASDESDRSTADSKSPIVSAGADRGRDFGTLFQAVQSSDLEVKLLCRRHNLEGLEVPRNVEVLGYLDIRRYRDTLGAASTIVLPSHPLAYPTGQTVLLHAMAMAKCCIVSDSEAIRDYVTHDHDAILVPPGDPEALRTAIARTMADSALRSRIGRAARQTFEGRFTLSAMWTPVFDLLREVASRD